ncbi:hypothetical protein [Rhodopila sp.]|uniref:hypothetical protein n=1 Tax=Rhodopila sp. TaxID=2480087 RepID=UPI002C814D3F|nr:hypothetical protein [Rhodopila sp.]HVZ09123.1 hypothetical protein [Rhodopila sp.]
MAKKKKTTSETNEKTKKKKTKHKGDSAPAAQVTLLPPSTVGTYEDGAPFDEVQYLEAKLILKPDRFTSVQAFRDFGAIVKRTAENEGVGFVEHPELTMRPQIREIVFGDTPDFRLYNNAFILRRRVRYLDGFPVGEPEIVLKYRHPDERAATEMDVRPRIDGKCEIKFKAEALPLKDRSGGYRILYSHNCQFGLSQVSKGQGLDIGALAGIFPALRRLNITDNERILVVNEGIVEEVLLPLGTLDFGKGVLAKCDVSLWRTRGEHKSLVGEFAFQVKFDRREKVAEKPKRMAGVFYMSLQNQVEDWLALGVTKTAMVYRLKGNEPQSHE